MNLRNVRSFGLLVCLAAAGTAPFLINCSSPAQDDSSAAGDEGALTGVDNKLGLGLAYDAKSGTVTATLKQSLAAGEQLRIRLRRGMPAFGDEAALDCDSITEATPITGAGSHDNAPIGKVVYQGPTVSQDFINLVNVYNDPRFQTDPVWSENRINEINQGGGPKALVEACVVRPGAASVKLQTNLEQAWDIGNATAADIASQSLGKSSLHFNAGDAGGAGVAPAEEALQSMESYGAKCVAELGEIPFFKKLADGSYDTFDCRDFKGTGDGHDPAAIDGVEGSMIPLTLNDAPVTKCDGAGPNGDPKQGGYDCVKKCDRAEFLSQGCEVGPTVTHATNAQGSHFVLLCRKVSGGEDIGWTKTKRFNDIAMIGNNPKTGKTCFFQNMIGSGTDGEHVPHPADRQKSRTLWDSPKGYCFESCHTTDPFIQSPWINQAKRSGGNIPVVPMMGFDRDYAISANDSPYYVVNMDAQGWAIPQQLVSDDSAACQTCHRTGGSTWMGSFANWTTGNATNGGPITDNDSYWGKITDGYKSFEKAHWMPMRLDGITADTWAGSKWEKAVDNLNKCNSNSADPSCAWADVPRGPGNPVAPSTAPSADPTPAPAPSNNN